ncbi:MAG TPA: ribonuclease D [Gaiellales bacterium]|jgi:ribonuclease D|nr:ribonuclease D [Gaiellales bacterium]
MELEQITTGAALGPLLDQARAEGTCAVDTEFVWERTYAPALCLVQLATAERLAVIDPLAGAPLDPVAELMADPAVEKVMHAPSGDLAAFVLHHDVRPRNVFDTQVAAGFAGYGGSPSLERLLDQAVGVHLRHDEGFTDWSRRPLTPTQIEYAADDVRYLLDAARALRARLAGQGRDAWVDEEMAQRYGDGATLVQDPDLAWRRVSGRGRLRGEQISALAAAAAWREREARRRDLPASWLIKDATLIEIARRRPRTPRDAESIRGLQLRKGAQLDGLLAAVAAAGPPPSGASDGDLPGEVRRRVRVVLPLASAVLQARCAEAGVASELVATRAELEALIAGQAMGADGGHPLLSGWRRELAGESLLALLRGEIALRVLPRAPHVAEQAG